MLIPHHKYLVKGMEMYFYFRDEFEDCLVWYYYVNKEVLYYRNWTLRYSDIEKLNNPLIMSKSIESINSV